MEPERTRLWNYADRVNWKKQVGHVTYAVVVVVVEIISEKHLRRV